MSSTKMFTRRTKYMLFLTLTLISLTSTFHYRRSLPLPSSLNSKLDPNVNTPPPPGPPPKKYKPQPTIVADPIIDNFPLAAAAQSAKDLPPIPPWNRPPKKHVDEKTPLFIGFTRNWRLLQQVVVSYITAGWPPEDIYVVENTGVMDSNANSLLSLQNPFFLNHTRLHLLGVNVLVTPTLFTFAQLQNFYIYTSIQNKWEQYFWGHMDIIALSYEDRYEPEKGPGEVRGEFEDRERFGSLENERKEDEDEEEKYKGFKSLYGNCVDALREAISTEGKSDEDKRWAMRFFMYDKLALVNVAAFVEVGAWDTQIPFYMTDCDMHARLQMAKLKIGEAPAGQIIDVASSLDDLYTLYRKVDSPPASFIDPAIFEKKVQDAEEAAKKDAPAHRKREIDTDLSSSVEGGKAERRAPDTETDKKSSSAWLSYITGSSPSSPPTWRSPSDTLASPLFTHLLHTIEAMQDSKASSARGRNTWQARQRGGEGDPFYRDSDGFETGIQMTIQHGRNVFAEKWGHRDCDVFERGLGLGDAWRVEHDW